MSDQQRHCPVRGALQPEGFWTSNHSGFLEFLDRALEILDRALEFLDRALEFLDRAVEFLDRALECLDRALQFLDRALQLLERRQEGALNRRTDLLFRGYREIGALSRLSQGIPGLCYCRARGTNATRGRHSLEMVPTPDCSMPRAEFPDTLMHLLVAGNESLDRQNRNTWSKAKSIALHREFGDEDEGTDTESKTSALAGWPPNPVGLNVGHLKGPTQLVLTILNGVDNTFSIQYSEPSIIRTSV